MARIEELAMKLTRCLAVGFVSLLGRVESAKAMQFPLYSNGCLPSPSGCAPSYTLKAAHAVGIEFSVARIFRPGSLSKIAEPVIGRVIVYMVNHGAWPFASDDQPSDAVGFIASAFDPYPQITSISVVVAGGFAGVLGIPGCCCTQVREATQRALPPRQNACLWIIIQELAQRVSIGQWFGSHRVSLIQRQWSEALSCCKQATPRFRIIADKEA